MPTAFLRFCQLFCKFERRLSPTMRQQHAAGHKTFVDSGKLVPITDPVTGAVSTAKISVAVLGASSLTAEPSDDPPSPFGLNHLANISSHRIFGGNHGFHSHFDS